MKRFQPIPIIQSIHTNKNSEKWQILLCTTRYRLLALSLREGWKIFFWSENVHSDVGVHFLQMIQRSLYVPGHQVGEKTDPWETWMTANNLQKETHEKLKRNSKKTIFLKRFGIVDNKFINNLLTEKINAQLTDTIKNSPCKKYYKMFEQRRIRKEIFSTKLLGSYTMINFQFSWTQDCQRSTRKHEWGISFATENNEINIPYTPCSQGCCPHLKPIAPWPQSFRQCVPMAMLIMATAIGHTKENPKAENEEEEERSLIFRRWPF